MRKGNYMNDKEEDEENFRRGKFNEKEQWTFLQ